MTSPKTKGRPPNGDLNDPAVVERLVARISAGEGIITICKDNDMPAESTVYLKMANDEDFRRLIAQAREAQQEREIDLTVEIADEATVEDWQVQKLRIWARQWRAGKLAPKKYGDRQQVEHSGSLTLEQLVSQATAAREGKKPEEPSK